MKKSPQETKINQPCVFGFQTSVLPVLVPVWNKMNASNYLDAFTTTGGRSTNTRVFCYMEITPTQAAGRWGLFLGQVSQHSNEGGAVGPLPSGALLGETSRVTGMHTAAHLHFFQHFEEFCRLKRKEGNLLFDKSRHKASQSKPHHGRDTGPPPWSTCPAP